ncbi:MAG: hypothetical protein AAFQ15_17635 [Pseudomonadota bacterium]
MSLALSFDAHIIPDDAVRPHAGRCKPPSVPSGRLRHLMAAAHAGDQASYARFLAGAAEYLDDHYKGMLVCSEREKAIEFALLAIHAKRSTCDTSRPARPWILAIAEYRRKGKVGDQHNGPI